MASSSIVWDPVSAPSLKRFKNLFARGSGDCGVNVMTYSSPSLALRSAGADVLTSRCAHGGLPVHLLALFRPTEGTADPTTAKKTRLGRSIRIKHTCLPGGNPIVAVSQQDLGAVGGREQRCRLRRCTRAYPHGYAEPTFWDRIVAQPIDVAQAHRVRMQTFTRPDDHLLLVGVEPHDIERRRTRYAEAAALTDGVVDDALVPTEPAPVDGHDIAGLGRPGFQALDDVGVATLRHEANILAVALLGNDQTIFAR